MTLFLWLYQQQKIYSLFISLRLLTFYRELIKPLFKVIFKKILSNLFIKLILTEFWSNKPIMASPETNKLRASIFQTNFLLLFCWNNYIVIEINQIKERTQIWTFFLYKKKKKTLICSAANSVKTKHKIKSISFLAKPNLAIIIIIIIFMSTKNLLN